MKKHDISCDQCETRVVNKNSLELHIKFKHEEHKSMKNKINVCVRCKSQLNQDKLKTPCMD